jgi:OOP family OmpA-OmpF porin
MRRSLIAASVALLASAPLVAFAQPIGGFYVSGEGGVGFLQNERIRGFSPPGLANVAPGPSGMAYQHGYAGLFSLGYGLDNGVRLEIEGSTRGNARDFGTRPANVAAQSGREDKLGVMGNVLFDMDIGSPYIFPYLGAGAGYQDVTQKLNETGGFGSEHVSGSKAAFAYQSMFGVSLPVPGMVGLSGLVEYRYLGLAGTRSYAGTLATGTTTAISRRTSDNDTHQILIGVRYAFNVPTPAAPMAASAPAPIAAPAPAPAHSYLVFFDWDRADLTTRAQQIVAEAAKNATSAATTRIDVAGHADKSGTATYNQTLSLARANAVAAELVRLGVAKSEISISAFGDTKPLVPTAAGVREPQNRRVEIVLH